MELYKIFFQVLLCDTLTTIKNSFDLLIQFPYLYEYFIIIIIADERYLMKVSKNINLIISLTGNTKFAFSLKSGINFYY